MCHFKAFSNEIANDSEATNAVGVVQYHVKLNLGALHGILYDVT